MQPRFRRLIILVLGLAALFPLLFSAAASGSQGPRQTLDLTPTAHFQLPFVVKQATPTASVISSPTPIPPDDLENEQAIAKQLNSHRITNGLPAVVAATELTQAARRHSRDMADHNITSHTGSDGSRPGQRIEEAGYDWIAWGEIIGWGFGGDPDSMVSWWMNSPDHRAILLSASYEDFGVGYAMDPDSEWGHYWTVDFGKRAAYGSAPSQLHLCTRVSLGELGGSSLVFSSSEPCQ
jgi:uncharacterized protein YkwD